jgi:hypothetical protein
MVVGVQQIPALLKGDGGQELLPRVGEDSVRTTLVKPVNLLFAEQEDPAKHELGHAVGVLFGIRKPKSAAP